MSFQAQLVLLLWLPITFYLFTRFPPRTAVMISFIGGMLFLPQRVGFRLPLIPDYRGMVATCYGIILGIIIYDPKIFGQLKLKWIDLPMMLWCVSPMISSLANGLGFYDGLNTSLDQTMIWGLPYFLGRLYLGNLTSLKELAINIIKGGLIYAPLCLFESRFSPQLHRLVYGYFQHSFAQTIRLGGFRPMVFMQHGLMVALWMMLATLCIFWLWKAKVMQKIWGIPMNWLVIAMLITFIMLRSTGTYLYLFFGLFVLFTAKWIRTNLPLLLLTAGIGFYLFINVTGSFNGSGLVAFAAQFNPQRAQSLEFRFNNEEILTEKARQQIIFGWGGWGRGRVVEEDWRGELVDVAVTDSLWIIIFGANGLVGLISFTTAMLLPVVRFCLWGYPTKSWFHPTIAAPAVLTVGLALYMVDILLNAMINPIFPLICGGLTGLSYKTITTTTSSKRELSKIEAHKRVIAARRLKSKFPN